MIEIPGYKINEQIYESSHSVIYRAIREEDNKPVVLKMLKSDYPTPEEIARFQREYKMTSGLVLEGAVRAYGLEKHRNTLVMVLEDFGGESLAKLQKDSETGETAGTRKGVHVPAVSPGYANLPEFLELAVKIADCLGQVHQRDIMHKDINPANIVFNPKTGQVKIIDFGISTELPPENPEIRHPNVLEGTLAYLSPEQTGRMNRSHEPVA